MAFLSIEVSSSSRLGRPDRVHLDYLTLTKKAFRPRSKYRNLSAQTLSLTSQKFGVFSTPHPPVLLGPQNSHSQLFPYFINRSVYHISQPSDQVILHMIHANCSLLMSCSRLMAIDCLTFHSTISHFRNHLQILKRVSVTEGVLSNIKIIRHQSVQFRYSFS